MKTENEIVTDRLATTKELLERKEAVISALFSEVQTKEFEARRFQTKLAEAERELEKTQKLSEERRVLAEGLVDDLIAYRAWMNLVRKLLADLRSEDLTEPVRKLINTAAEELFPSYVNVSTSNGGNNGNE